MREPFTEQELRDGTFTRSVPSIVPVRTTRFVRHYWPDYNHELTASEPKPATFFQYVTAGRKTTFETGEAHQAVDKIAEGIVRLARLANPAARIGAKAQACADFRSAIGTSRTQGAVPRDYCRFHESRDGSTSGKWDADWCAQVIAISGELAGTAFARNQQADFLAWPAAAQAGQQVQKQRRDNFFRYPAEASTVAIRVGSVHSVKGETHTATMVLDTFFHGHHLQELKPWLLGANAGIGGEGVRMQARLKQHYVGMTRPMHLLCLAMKDTFTPEEIETLKARAWRGARIQPAGIVWL